MKFINNVSTEILIVYGLIAVVLLLIVFVLIYDNIVSRKKLMNNKNLFNNNFVRNNLAPEKDELLPITDISNAEVTKKEIAKERVIPKVEEEQINIQEEIKQVEVKSVEPIIIESVKEEIEELDTNDYTMYDFTVPKIDYIQEIKYVDENPELERTNAQIELEKLTKELEKHEEEKKEEPIVLTSFEINQEENAIISLDELMKNGDRLYQENEEVQYIDEGNEPINLAELKAKFSTLEKEIETLEPLTEIAPIEEPIVESTKPVVEMIEFLDDNKIYERKFEISPEISPIYGLHKSSEKMVELEPELIVSPTLEFEQTADYDKLDQELKKTNEFLQMLKELEKNLD